MTEWKQIDEHPNYEVSDDGQVRNKRGWVLKPTPSREGYLCLGLHINGKQKTVYISRLVAKAFIPNPKGLPWVRRLNGVKTDNRVENLEWCTPKQSAHHRDNKPTEKGARSNLIQRGLAALRGWCSMNHRQPSQP
jgi:hypothetical protein